MSVRIAGKSSEGADPASGYAAHRSSISAVIISCNEADVIESCLQSVAGWVDEILVVDMLSTDGTGDIVLQYTDRLFDHERLSYVEPARNFALAKATGDWIILLDPDERVPLALAGELRSLSKRKDLDVVLVPRRNWAFGAPLSTAHQQDELIRFFRSGRLKWPANVHGHPVLAGLRLHRLPRQNGLWIEHESWRTVTSILDRHIRYTQMEVENFRARGEAYSTRRMLHHILSVFLKIFVDGNGYKDGVRGLWTTIILMMYHLQSYLYLWESDGFPDSGSDSVRRWGTHIQHIVAVLRIIKRTAQILTYLWERVLSILKSGFE